MSFIYRLKLLGNYVVRQSKLIEDGVNGFLIDSQSSEKIIDVLKNLDTNYDNTSIAMAVRKTIVHYSYDNFVSFYVSKYSQGLK